MTTFDGRRPYIRVSLLIRGGEDPDEITRILNVTPDETHRKGAPIPLPPGVTYTVKKTRVYATSIWKLNAHLKHYSYDVEAYVKNILHCLEGVNDALAKLDRRRFNVSIDVSLDLLLDASTAATGLSKETMKTLARLGASFDVDTYVWKELPQYAIEGLQQFKS